MTGKTWEALQTSIKNSGYTFPVLAANNLDYDPTTKGQERPSLIEHSDGVKSGVTSEGVGTQVSDDEIARFYPYRLIDGSHRSAVLRLGTHYFNEGHDNSEAWAKGEKIPDSPGPDMLAYLAWREDFTIPCVVLNVSSTDAMSAEILHNTARGSHDLNSMKDIVNNLITIGGMSEAWVARNLFLDIESIHRMQQLSGLKAAFSEKGNDINSADLAWTPESDNSYERKASTFIQRRANNYINEYQQNHPEWKHPSSGSALDVALTIGFDQDQAYKEFQDL
jgi:hypothetical protein